MRKKIISLVFVVSCLGMSAFSQTPKPAPSPALTAAPKPQPEHFTMVAALPRSRTTTAWADVRVKHYSSNATTQRLAAVLVEGGQEALVRELEKLKPIGHASLSARVGFFDLKLIRSRKTATGRRIIGVSDRPIGFLEAYNGGRSTDYTLGIIVLDLKLNNKGKEVGQGMLLYAAEVKIKKGKLEIEYLGMDPVPLTNVRKN